MPLNRSGHSGAGNQIFSVRTVPLVLALMMIMAAGCGRGGDAADLLPGPLARWLNLDGGGGAGGAAAVLSAPASLEASAGEESSFSLVLSISGSPAPEASYSCLSHARPSEVRRRAGCPQGMVVDAASGLVVWTPARSQATAAGLNWEVVFSGKVGGGTSAQTSSGVSVALPNIPPVSASLSCSPSSSTTGNSGELPPVSCSAPIFVDLDGDSPVFSVVSACPDASVAIDPSSGILTGAVPSAAKTCVVVVAVSDRVGGPAARTATLTFSTPIMAVVAPSVVEGEAGATLAAEAHLDPRKTPLPAPGAISWSCRLVGPAGEDVGECPSSFSVVPSASAPAASLVFASAALDVLAPPRVVVIAAAHGRSAVSPPISYRLVGGAASAADARFPRVTGVSTRTRPGTYGPGGRVEVTLTLSRVVRVEGVSGVGLKLETGTVDALATLMSPTAGQLSSSLTFSLAVAPGMNAASLAVSGETPQITIAAGSSARSSSGMNLVTSIPPEVSLTASSAVRLGDGAFHPAGCAYGSQTVAHGDSVSVERFASSIVAAGASCSPEIRVASCSNGTLSSFSGSFMAETCEQEDAPSLAAALAGPAADGFLNAAELLDGSTPLVSASSDFGALSYARVPAGSAAGSCASLPAFAFSALLPTASLLAATAEGSYAYCVRARTALGSETRTVTVPFTKDATPPAFSLPSGRGGLGTLTYVYTASPPTVSGICAVSPITTFIFPIRSGTPEVNLTCDAGGTYLLEGATNPRYPQTKFVLQTAVDAAGHMATTDGFSVVATSFTAYRRPNGTIAGSCTDSSAMRFMQRVDQNFLPQTVSCSGGSYDSGAIDVSSVAVVYQYANVSFSNFLDGRYVLPEPPAIEPSAAAADGSLSLAEQSADLDLISPPSPTGHDALAYALITASTDCAAAPSYSASIPRAAAAAGAEAPLKVCARASDLAGNPPAYASSLSFTVTFNSPPAPFGSEPFTIGGYSATTSFDLQDVYISDGGVTPNIEFQNSTGSAIRFRNLMFLNDPEAAATKIDQFFMTGSHVRITRVTNGTPFVFEGDVSGTGFSGPNYVVFVDNRVDWITCIGSCASSSTTSAIAEKTTTETGQVGERLAHSPLPTTTDLDGDPVAYEDLWQIHRPSDPGADGDGWVTVQTGGETLTVTATMLVPLTGTEARLKRVASDGRGGETAAVSNAFTLPRINSAPTTGSVTCSVGSVVVTRGRQLDGVACEVSGYSDPDGDPMRFSYSSTCPAFSVEAQIGVITGTMPSGQTETCAITIAAADDKGLSFPSGAATVTIIPTLGQLTGASLTGVSTNDQCELSVDVAVSRIFDPTHPVHLDSYQGTIEGLPGSFSPPSEAQDDRIILSMAGDLATAPSSRSIPTTFFATTSYHSGTASTARKIAISPILVQSPRPTSAASMADIRAPGEQALFGGTGPSVCGDGSCSGSRGQISVGTAHACAVTATGEVQCWGRGTSGQLGNGLSTNQTTPVYVLTSGTNQAQNRLSGVRQVSAGDGFSCALLASGNVMCWGAATGFAGRLGDGDSSSHTALNPVYVLASGSNQAANRLTGIVQVSAGRATACALATSGNVMCWGDTTYMGIGVQFQIRENPALVLTSGTTDVVSNRLGGVVQISVGSNRACATTGAGEALCWGQVASAGQMGDGSSSTSTRLNPVYILTSGTNQAQNHLSGVRAVAAATGYWACALMTSGNVMCWGENSQGQTGDGTTSVTREYPAYVLTSGTVDAGTNRLSGTVSASSSCALLSDSRMRCWGKNDTGGLVGAGGIGNQSLNAVYVLDSGNEQTANHFFGAVAADVGGGSNACALTSAGTVRCWGNGSSGTMGNGSTATINFNPQPAVSSLAPAALSCAVYGVDLRN